MSEPNSNPVPEPAPRDPLRKVKIGLSTAALILGLATIVVTLTHGGGAQSRGILLGAVLAIMAGARLWLTMRHNA
ncbi:MAG: hypothetical protein ACRDKI_10075 [Solirubrobacterales bacterium]